MIIFESILTTFEESIIFWGSWGPQYWKSARAYKIWNRNQVKLAQIRETHCTNCSEDVSWHWIGFFWSNYWLQTVVFFEWKRERLLIFCTPVQHNRSDFEEKRCWWLTNSRRIPPPSLLPLFPIVICHSLLCQKTFFNYLSSQRTARGEHKSHTSLRKEMKQIVETSHT